MRICFILSSIHFYYERRFKLKKNKKLSRLVGVLLALILAFGVMVTPALASENTEYTVFISFEGFNIGHGFYIEPTAINIAPGTTAWDASSALLTQAGYEYSLNDWGFLDRIHGFHPGDPVNPPSFITIELTYGPEDGSLGAFDYSTYSGWQFTVNHTMADVGADSFVLADGDVVRWKFSVEGWGAELGLGMDQGFWTDPLYSHEDKTQLIRDISADGVDEATREAALAVIINPLATAEEIAAVFGAQDNEYENGKEYETEYDYEADYDYETDYDDETDYDADETADEIMFVWTNPFTDVSSNDWFYFYVASAYTNGTMTGTAPGMFAPNANLSRAMAVTILWRIEGNPVVEDENSFNDVRSGRWYTNAVNWAAANDLIAPAASFAPSQGITAEDFAAMLVAFDTVMWYGTVDVDYIFAEFAPGSVITRGEAAAIILRFFESMGQ